jgi:protein O-mannosyl-transferase
MSFAPPRVARHAGVACAIVLVAAIAAIYWQTLGHGFLRFDDHAYIVANPHVRGGLTASNAHWALTARQASNWHPLAWVSHMADCSAYGLWPGGHHLTNVVLHAINALLVMAVMRSLGETLPVAAVVAGLFAVHPLRVESVAWVAERKDLLCGTFFLLAVWAHVATVRGAIRSGIGLPLCAVAMALGALSKGMIVTLPCVLLLLDWWPLRRLVWSPGGPAHTATGVVGVVVEKLPLFAISAATCWMTIWAQETAIASMTDVPLRLRLAGAAINVADYLGMFLAPVNLSGFYPWDPARITAARTAASLAVITTVTVIAVATRDRQPRLLVGWLWFLGMLVPVSGIVQVGRANLADRFTYLPMVGLAWAIVGIAFDAWQNAAATFGDPSRRRWCERLGAAVAAATLLTLAAISWFQTTHWRDTQTFWRRSLACSPRNATGHLNIAVDLRDQGRLDEALFHLASAHEIEPNAVDILLTLGIALADAGRRTEAEQCLARAAALEPGNPAVGQAYRRIRRPE